MSTWQDIGTAPRDGTAIDLWFGDRVPRRYARVVDCEWRQAETVPGWYAPSEGGVLYLVGYGATHWMPRPSPPSKEGE